MKKEIVAMRSDTVPPKPSAGVNSSYVFDRDERRDVDEAADRTVARIKSAAKARRDAEILKMTNGA